MSLLKKNTKKEFVLFDLNKDGRGIGKDEEALSGPPYNFKRGFKLFISKFWNLISLNLIILLLTVIPVVLIVYFDFTGPKTPTYESLLFVPLSGAATMVGHSLPALEVILDFHSHIIGVSIRDLPQYLKLGIPLLFLFITFGWQNCGVSYVTRSMIKGDPLFLISDYWFCIKRNWKQGLTMGMLDFMCITALTVNFLYYNQMAGSFGNDLMLIFTIALAVIYMFMRMYIYLMVITFNMKSTKILKNALIFSVIGAKSNFMAVLCVILLLLAVALLTFILHYIRISATGILIGFLTVFASASFISTYCAYPVILKYMVIQDDEDDIEEESVNAEA
jgi:uncharacterized membrane protein YesL